MQWKWCQLEPFILKISPSLVKLIPSQFRVNNDVAILWCDHSIEFKFSLTVPLILSHGTLRFLVFYMKFRIFVEVLFGKQNLWVLRRINISCWERLRLIWLSRGDFSSLFPGVRSLSWRWTNFSKQVCLHEGVAVRTLVKEVLEMDEKYFISKG